MVSPVGRLHLHGLGLLTAQHTPVSVRALDKIKYRVIYADQTSALLENSAAHPRVSEVFHPSLPTHPDRSIINEQYVRPGSLLSFRVAGADEGAARHVADVLATTLIVRYAERKSTRLNSSH